MWVFVAAALANEPLPQLERRAYVGGQVELSAGAGLWQMPSYSKGDSELFPRINGHITVSSHLRRLVLGLHGAAWSIPRPDFDLTGVRVEPRIGVAAGLWRTVRLDLTAGLALDRPGSRIAIGPVLAGTTRWWPGKEPGRGPFVALEARLAPRFSWHETMMMCSTPCNQTHMTNPGGTGALLGLGWAFHEGTPRPPVK